MNHKKIAVLVITGCVCALGVGAQSVLEINPNLTSYGFAPGPNQAVVLFDGTTLTPFLGANFGNAGNLLFEAEKNKISDASSQGSFLISSSPLTDNQNISTVSGWANSLNFPVSGYYGLQWDLNSSIYYGWMNITVAPNHIFPVYNDYTINTVAMNATANDTSLVLSETPVPEPSTLALGVLGLGSVALARRRVLS